MIKRCIQCITYTIFLITSCEAPEERTPISEDQFAKHIRTTEAMAAEDQLKSFQLPPGFKIELFASEPDIGKPMNLSFDAKGRLWVTQSQAYPFQDSTGATADRITILEDLDNDGKADRFTTFADSLNIPIGIQPVNDGAIAFSIPNVYHLVDTDGDDRVDHRKVLLSGFEYKDTHGMINNFFRGLDGWIHANHGFSNVSEVVGTDNKAPVRMQSGNTFRFKPDGSGVEFTTTGRVNPFGYAMDEFGYFYSVDCHTSPLYQLIRGADYPHFGKKPTGIGFGPALMPHNYGSTALAGLDYYTCDQFPEAYRQSFYLGDVVKSRVYRATIDMAGTTPVPKWEPDFIVSQDPWFRPVDIKVGPDGALYIADFYNRIIGHYEVPLDHPGRDRERGRIWRITYEGQEKFHQSVDWSEKGLQELIEGLNQPSLNVRMMVADQIVDRFGDSASSAIRDLLDDNEATVQQLIHSLWILFRLERMDQELINWALSHQHDLVRLHQLQVLFEMDHLDEQVINRIRSLVNHQNPHIVRASIMILAQHPSFDQVELLLNQSKLVTDKDTHLSYALKQALRDHFRSQTLLARVMEYSWKNDQIPVMAAAMVGVDQAKAAQFLAGHLKKFKEDPDLVVYSNHIARLLPESELDQFQKQLRTLSRDQQYLQYQLIESIQNGMAQRGSKTHYLENWAVSWATVTLEQPSTTSLKEELSEVEQLQIFACQVAGNYQVEQLRSELLDLLRSEPTHPQLRTEAARALLTISADHFEQVTMVAQQAPQADPVREQLYLLLVQQKTEESYILVSNAINSLSFDTQKKLVMSMANDQQGIEEILKVARSMEISPKMLLEPSIQSLLSSNMNNQQKAEYEDITENLTPFSDETQSIIRERVSGYQSASKSLSAGELVFKQHCGSCHQIGGSGGNIGPQLDGIGNRGLLALTEKTLDPNRSVSKSFVNYAITLNDGTVKQGLYRRDEGNLKIFADLSGTEFSVPLGDIKDQTALPFTLMPDNFSNIIPESDYYQLMHYLLEQK